MRSVSVIPVVGVGEVGPGDDVATLLLSAGMALIDGDVVVVSSKVVSKSLGLWAHDRESAVRSQSTRVVAERQAGDRVTRIVESAAGPVMAAGGVDASNTGGRGEVLLLPADPDAEAERLRQALLARTGLRRVGVVVSDTAGRPWRTGQTDFALGASGLTVLDDLRGRRDADGQPLSVTARAVADELAAAADLVKGKTDRVPAAVVRGTPWASGERGAGAASLIRTGPEDWFDHGRAEAVRAALGVAPGSDAAIRTGIPSTAEEDAAIRTRRAVAVALEGTVGAAMTVEGDRVVVHGEDRYHLGIATARLTAALWGERLAATLPPECTGASVAVVVHER